MNSRPAEQEDRSNPSDDKHAAGGEEENDWDEYEDEVASAVAFASWQQASELQLDWDEDDAEVAAEREKVHGHGENWEDRATDDEPADDVTYHWGKGKDEGH